MTCSRCGDKHGRRSGQEYCHSCETFLRKAKKLASKNAAGIQASAIFRKAEKAAEFKAQHGPVKHWHRDDSGNLVLVSGDK